MISIKSRHEIQLMREAGRVVAQVFARLEQLIEPGVSTWQLDQEAARIIKNAGATASFLGYGGPPPFPASTCISLNEEVVHGIPSPDRLLAEGDIVSIDVGANLNGYHGDAARTYCVGAVDPEVRRLVEVTERSFWLGMEKAVIGNRIGDLSHAIQSHCEAHGFGVVRELTGHGIGQALHEAPDVLNFGRAGRGQRFLEGMTLACEPMITLGDPAIRLLPDGWTIVTADGRAAAHYENTFAVTVNGPEVLTAL